MPHNHSFVFLTLNAVNCVQCLDFHAEAAGPLRIYRDEATAIAFLLFALAC